MKIGTVVSVVVVMMVVVSLVFLLATDSTHKGVLVESPKALIASPVALPDVALTTLSGESVYLHDLLGAPAVISVWSVSCPLCIRQVADLAAVQEGVGDDVHAIALNRGDAVDAVREIAETANLVGRVVVGIDITDDWYAAVGGLTMPETLFIAPDGRIQFHARGPLTQEELRERIELSRQTGGVL